MFVVTRDSIDDEALVHLIRLKVVELRNDIATNGCVAGGVECCDLTAHTVARRVIGNGQVLVLHNFAIISHFIGSIFLAFAVPLQVLINSSVSVFVNTRLYLIVKNLFLKLYFEKIYFVPHFDTEALKEFPADRKSFADYTMVLKTG